ncbi:MULTISPECIES: GNAT family N-acetyltransferase [Bacillaceae]|uniref:GNAT family N-acetyltransferase n=1 Tax=Bacillaceae TaxID=186817 RepID=UPI000BA7CAC3|nr:MULTISPECIES: GNAT family N-acetyltransferase [Bacillaceae]PAE26699.1 GNAT family N-acetyltransferase [Bacillus sp. 7894-2]URM31579.1 GNAT family N-acetyltransferase [Cytobacillus firmus]
MKVLETDRLILRWLTPDDAAFILELLNEPAWIRYIGDKGVRTLEDAKNYILTGPKKMYSQFGFGLFLVERKEGSIPIGLCGLIKRDTLDNVDIGFAFLSKYQTQGYGFESASATLKYGHEQLDMERILAITSLDNYASSRLLEKIGMNYEGTITLDKEELKLFASEK